jgi:hypothetical protein
MRTGPREEEEEEEEEEDDAPLIFTLLNYHASACFGPICSQSLGGSKCIWEMVFVFLLSFLSTGLDGPPPDDGLQMGRNM